MRLSEPQITLLRKMAEGHQSTVLETATAFALKRRGLIERVSCKRCWNCLHDRVCIEKDEQITDAGREVLKGVK